MIDTHIGFIGAGQMARALASGFVESELLQPTQLFFSDPADQTIELTLEKLPGATRCNGSVELLRQCEVIFLAVKPQFVDSVAQQIQRQFLGKHLLVSVVAGVTIKSLVERFGVSRVIRVMPNTPSLIRQGAAGVSRGSEASDQDLEMVLKLMHSVGVAFEVNEGQIDAVTGLSGSGPAFVFSVIEAMSDGGVKMGLPRAIANQLAIQTVLGAAQLVQSSGEHPAVLRDQVSSPGGTTIAGLHELENGALNATLMNAIEAATERARELGQE